ncbi:hypothetical protein [Bacillus sp. REN3]|uniref:hypothetical protein n=1 Tax=Bacillus sp. REN3 TaxID=2802440 RepID=UPI001AEF22A0|nr:hypothetical protein [Bacillus sp. REN3]
MKKLVLCECGSGKFKEECCPTSIRAWAQPIAGPEDRKKILEMLLIGSEFEMRNRGLMHYYGKDFIDYKRERPKDQRRNYFLMVISKYMTDYLEDDFPPSWQECDQYFWEEFLLAQYPYHLQISREQNELEKFSKELKKFTSWLDSRYQTRHTDIVKELIDTHFDELKTCESTLNVLFEHTFPNILDRKANLQADMLENLSSLDQFDETTFTLLKVININGPIVHATDMVTNQSIQIIDVPMKAILPGVILGGTIGKTKGSWLWTWHSPSVVFPSKAEKHLENVLFYC